MNFAQKIQMHESEPTSSAEVTNTHCLRLGFTVWRDAVTMMLFQRREFQVSDVSYADAIKLLAHLVEYCPSGIKEETLVAAIEKLQAVKAPQLYRCDIDFGEIDNVDPVTEQVSKTYALVIVSTFILASKPEPVVILIQALMD